MPDTQIQQIDGLPPGAILKPIQTQDIQGLPAGAILKPIASAPVANPYQQAADRTGFLPNTSMSAGTSSYKAPDDPYAVKPNTFKSLLSNAGIPTSQPATTEAVRGMLHPQADPSETNPVVHALEQWPLIGGDTRARADLAKRAANETGGVAIAHKLASWVPLAGPAVTAAQDKYNQGDYTGAVGAGLNALLSMEGLKGAVTPKPNVLPETSLGQLTNEAAARPPVNPPAPPLVAKVASKVLGGGPETMQKVPIKQQTAAGSATNAEVAQYAKDNGIDLLPGQATGARGIQTIQAVGERAVVAPGDLPDVLDKQKAAFGNLVDDFKTRVGSEAIPDTEAAGTSLKSQAQAGLDNLKQSAQQDYNGFQQQAGDIPVDLSDVKAKYAQKLADQAEALKNVPAQYANPIRNVLNKLSGIEAGGEVNPKLQADFDNAVNSYGLNADQQAALRTKLGLPQEGVTAGVKMSTAQQLRSAYLDIARDYTGNVPKPVQRIAGQAAADIDSAMGKAADSVGATDQWRQANSKWKQLQQTYNNPGHPLYKILQEPDAVKVPSKLLGKGNYGGSPNTVRQLQQAGIDLSPLKREVAQQIADKNFALTNGGRGLAGYSTDFLKTLYSPAELDELTKMGRVGRAIKFEMNPSGTSNVGEGGHQLRAVLRHAGSVGAGGGAGFLLGGPIGAVIGATLAGGGDAMIPSIASRITTSKAFARATMGDIFAARPRGIMDVLGGRDIPPPEEPPPTGGAPTEPTPQPGNPPATPKANAVAAADERGTKAPQKRTFERQSDADVKQFFSYRFDQLRNELKAAQASGDQSAVADVQRRMGELDQIQRQPRPLQDVLAGKPPKTAGDYENEIVKASSVNTQQQAQSALEQASQNLFGKPFAALTDAEKAKTYSAGAKIQDKARAAAANGQRSLSDILSGKPPSQAPRIISQQDINNLYGRKISIGGKEAEIVGFPNGRIKVRMPNGDLSTADWEDATIASRPLTDFLSNKPPKKGGK